MKILQRLVALGARTHIWGRHGDTFLHHMSGNYFVSGDADFFSELLRLGAPVNPRRSDPDGYGRDSSLGSEKSYWKEPPLHHMIARCTLPVLITFVSAI